MESLRLKYLFLKFIKSYEKGTCKKYFPFQILAHQYSKEEKEMDIVVKTEPPDDADYFQGKIKKKKRSFPVIQIFCLTNCMYIQYST